MKLTPEQISQYASNAGFVGNDLETAVAIALAESGGDTEALGDVDITLGGSWGLWQINLKWHPEFYDDPNSLQDPQTNARAAYDIYRHGGFNAWSTYKSGRYKAFLSTQSNNETD